MELKCEGDSNATGFEYDRHGTLSLYALPERHSALHAHLFVRAQSGEFNATSLFDLSMQYSIPVAGRITPWMKAA